MTPAEIARVVDERARQRTTIRSVAMPLSTGHLFSVPVDRFREIAAWAEEHGIPWTSSNTKHTYVALLKIDDPREAVLFALMWCQ